MRTDSKTFNHPGLTKDHHRAILTYLLESAAYENIFEHYGSSDFISAMRDVAITACSQVVNHQ